MLDIVSVATIIACAALTSVTAYYYKIKMNTINLKKPRQILTHEGSIMSLEQYRTNRSATIKKSTTNPLTNNDNTIQEIKK